MQSIESTFFLQHRRFFVVSFCLLICLALSTSLALAMGDMNEVVDPLPQGCIHGTPPGEEAPLCCLSGFVFQQTKAVDGAKVTISDRQGEIGTTYTQQYQGLETNPYYYVDLTKLTRSIKPTDVITLVVSYNGITTLPVAYTVKPGGQNFNFNLYNVNALVPNTTLEGEAEAGKFFYTGDLATDSQGNVYVVDWLNYRIQVFDPNGKFLRVWGDRSLLPGEWSGIAGITIDKRTDAVYLVQQRWMAQFTTDGDLVNVWRAPTANPYIFSRPGDIEVDGQGNLFVADYHPGVNKFDAKSNWVPWSGWGQQLNSFISTIALSPVAPYIFATKSNNYSIYRIGDDGFPITQTALSQTGVITFDRPTGIAFDADGFLYISDCDNTVRVRKFAVRANNSLEEQPFAWERQPGYCSTRMVFHGDFFYLGAYADQFIYQYKRDGRFVRKWGGLATNPGQVADPRGLATSPVTGELYGIDAGTRRIFKLMDGQIVNSWNAQDIGVSVLIPTGITFDRAGKMYVTTNNAIIRLGLTGNQLITETIVGNLIGGTNSELHSPNALAVDQNNNVFVNDYLHDRVAIVRLDNNTMQTIAAMDAISRPVGITIDDTNPASVVVYVAHAGVKNVQSNVRLTRFNFVPAGLPNNAIQNITHWGENGWGDVSNSFIEPFGLYWEETQSQLWVSGCFKHRGCDARIAKFDNNGQLQGLYSKFGIGPGDLARPVGLTVDRQGIVHVADNSSGSTRIISFRPLAPSAPVATIEHLSSAELAPGDILTVNAAGQDGDETNIIAAYQVTTTSGFSITVPNPQISMPNIEINIPIIEGETQVDKLGRGLHFLYLRVLDNEGVPSQWVKRTVYVAWRRPSTPDPSQTPTPTPDPDRTPPPPPAICPVGGLWTLLLYLDADNTNDGQQLFKAYLTSLEKLKTLSHACVQVAVQIDGGLSINDSTITDTQRWLIRPNLPTENPTPIAEQAMDTPAALTEFVQWGQQALPADHYYLAIADHGNAYLGTAFDHTSDREKNQALWTARLKASDLRTALSAPGILPIDILHLDACSMALLDVAYDLRGRVKLMIATQYIGWSFFAYADYASYIGQATEPKQLATLIVNRYGNLAWQYRLPYTLSALDLTRVEPMKTAVDQLAMFLKAWLNTDANNDINHKRLFEEVRNKSIFFDSTTDLINSPRDAYVDLKDFVTRVKQAGLTDEITMAADKVLSELGRDDGLILAKRQSTNVNLPNGKDIGNDVGEASGISLYYPVEGNDRLVLPLDAGAEIAAAAGELDTSVAYTYTQIYADYINDKLFDFTRAARWDEFLQAAYGEPPVGVQLEQPPAPIAPPEPVNNTHVTLHQDYRLDDKENNGPSAGEMVHFEAQIDNQSEITLTHVVLVQRLNQAVQPEVSSTQYPCNENDPQEVCIQLADIPAKSSAHPVTFVLTLSTTAPIVTEAILYVNDKPFSDSVTPTEQKNQLYLPVVMK